jgi:DNA polymerase III gamma/tau subunit
VEQLEKICRDEKIKYTEEGLFLIANAADGSLRDAETIFDQVSAYSSGDINEKNVADLLGIPDSNYFTEIIESVKRSDIIRMLKTVEKYINNEGDIKIFAMSMIRFLKEGVLIIKLPYDDELLDITQKNYDEMKTQFSDFSSEDLLRMINIFIDLYKDLKGEPGERFLLENALFKMMDYKNIVNIGDLRNEIIAFIENDRNFRSRVISHEREGDSALHETKTNDPKTAFFNLLSEDNIKRSMLKSIISAEIGREGRLSVVISDPNNLAYFEKEKKEMENELKKRTGFNLIIELQLAEDKKLETVSGVNKNPGQRAEEVEKPQIVKEIINLFDGKVQ